MFSLIATKNREVMEMQYMVLKTIREGYCAGNEDQHEQCIGPFCSRVMAETVLCNLASLPDIQNAWIENLPDSDDDDEQ